MCWEARNSTCVLRDVFSSRFSNDLRLHVSNGRGKRSRDASGSFSSSPCTARGSTTWQLGRSDPAGRPFPSNSAPCEVQTYGRSGVDGAFAKRGAHVRTSGMRHLQSGGSAWFREKRKSRADRRETDRRDTREAFTRREGRRRKEGSRVAQPWGRGSPRSVGVPPRAGRPTVTSSRSDPWRWRWWPERLRSARRRVEPRW